VSCLCTQLLFFFPVVKAPPYQVSESGYGSFTLPIEIYFKSKEEPKKIRFEYDLLLQLEKSDLVTNTRCEKLTFMNPNESFRHKLFKAGGVSVGVNLWSPTLCFIHLYRLPSRAPMTLLPPHHRVLHRPHLDHPTNQLPLPLHPHQPTMRCSKTCLVHL
jgi:hypothetical protein